VNGALLAKSGWGKSWMTQALLERNIPEYEATVVMDMKDEYRGLVKAGLLVHLIVGPHEAQWSVEQWREFLRQNPRVVLAKLDTMNLDTWLEVCNRVAGAVRTLQRSQFVCIEEAHFVAPQVGAIPPEIEHLATTGRGEGTSTVVVSQRPAKVDETVLAQCMFRLIGGFESDRDLTKVEGFTEYPVDLHNPQAGEVSHVPDELQPDDSGEGGLAPALRKFEDDQGRTIGSEWVYSDDSGTRKRIDSRYRQMDSTHHGQDGKDVLLPDMDE